MTDDENKRQRHLAEMMIAQCDGRTVQYRERDGEWIAVPYMIYNIADSDKLRLQWRIKPEPRGWWLCPRCAQSLDKSCSQRVTDSLLKSHRDGAGVVCESSFIKVREVLND